MGYGLHNSIGEIMSHRPYQDNFYNLSETVRSHESRGRQARKVSHLIATQVNADVRKLMSQWTCLDVGCSSGIITSEVSGYFNKTIGLEYDIVSLSNASEESRAKIKFCRGDAMNMPFPDKSVQAVICAQVYEHVPNDRLLFAEIRRVLAPGGIVFFSGPNWLYPIEPHYFLPFLHWLPDGLASAYLRLFRKGDHYYERSRIWWSLRQEFSGYEIADLTSAVVKMKLSESQKTWSKFFLRMPDAWWNALSPLLPNFNWLIYKPVE